MGVAIAPRSLDPAERAVVDLILAPEFSGAVELRGQVDRVRTVAKWAIDSASVDLQVLEGPPRAPLPSGPIPVDATVVDEAGLLLGEILLWTTDGYLSAIEYAWYGDVPPIALPEVRRISVVVRVGG
jgi:hypothetical protein